MNADLTSFALYEAYGTRPYEWGDDPDRQKANTKEEETDLQLLNEGMRYRDLETGTFLTRDPIGYADGMNIYSYVHCNPITRFDAFGLSGDDTSGDSGDDDSMTGDQASEDTTGDSADEAATDVTPPEDDSKSKADEDKEKAEELNDQDTDGELSDSQGKDKEKPNGESSQNDSGSSSGNQSTPSADEMKNMSEAELLDLLKTLDENEADKVETAGGGKNLLITLIISAASKMSDPAGTNATTPEWKTGGVKAPNTARPPVATGTGPKPPAMPKSVPKPPGKLLRALRGAGKFLKSIPMPLMLDIQPKYEGPQEA